MSLPARRVRNKVQRSIVVKILSQKRRDLIETESRSVEIEKKEYAGGLSKLKTITSSSLYSSCRMPSVLLLDDKSYARGSSAPDH